MVLRGSGGYKDLKQTGKDKVNNPPILGKCARKDTSNNLDNKDQENGPSKKALTEVDVIDLTFSSSPALEPMDLDTSPFITNARSSSAVDYGSGDEEQVSKYHTKLNYWTEI